MKNIILSLIVLVLLSCTNEPAPVVETCPNFEQITTAKSNWNCTGTYWTTNVAAGDSTARLYIPYVFPNIEPQKDYYLKVVVKVPDSVKLTLVTSDLNRFTYRYDKTLTTGEFKTVLKLDFFASVVIWFTNETGEPVALELEEFRLFQL